jgi:hypothetical protein
LLLVGFRGRVTVGAVAVAVGLLALYRTYDVYRRYREHVDGTDETGDANRGSDPDTGVSGSSNAGGEGSG